MSTAGKPLGTPKRLYTGFAHGNNSLKGRACHRTPTAALRDRVMTPRYGFTFRGLTVGDVGGASITGSGKVHGLKKIGNFSGSYTGLARMGPTGYALDAW